jgi:hypothetical protein
VKVQQPAQEQAADQQLPPRPPPEPLVSPMRPDVNPVHPIWIIEPKDPAKRLSPGTPYPRIGFMPGQQRVIEMAPSRPLSWSERQARDRDECKAYVYGLLNWGVKKSKVMALLQKAWEAEAPILVYEALFDLQLGLEDQLGFRF